MRSAKLQPAGRPRQAGWRIARRACPRANPVPGAGASGGGKRTCAWTNRDCAKTQSAEGQRRFAPPRGALPAFQAMGDANAGSTADFPARMS